MPTATIDQVIEALRPVEDPELHRSIVDLDMVHDIAVSSQGVSLTITLTVAGCPMRNEITKLVTDALIMAIWRRGKPDSLLHHSDQGSQYTSEHFHGLLKEQGITCSMSRAGEVWDNSAMESFFSSLKTEHTARKVYRSREQARSDVFDYIERFYNPTRRHSTLGYVSPIEFEKARRA